MIVAHRYHLTRPRRTRNSNNLGLSFSLPLRPGTLFFSPSPPMLPAVSTKSVLTSCSKLREGEIFSRIQTTIAHKYCKLQIASISQNPSSPQSHINFANYKSPQSHMNDANCIIVTIAHKCSPADCSWTSFLRKKGWYLRLNFFQKLSAKSGGHMIWSRASGAEALASFQTRQRCLALENFFSREIIFWDVFYYFAHIVHSFWIWYCLSTKANSYPNSLSSVVPDCPVRQPPGSVEIGGKNKYTHVLHLPTQNAIFFFLNPKMQSFSWNLEAKKRLFVSQFLFPKAFSVTEMVGRDVRKGWSWRII